MCLCVLSHSIEQPIVTLYTQRTDFRDTSQVIRNREITDRNIRGKKGEEIYKLLKKWKQNKGQCAKIEVSSA